METVMGTNNPSHLPVAMSLCVFVWKLEEQWWIKEGALIGASWSVPWFYAKREGVATLARVANSQKIVQKFQVMQTMKKTFKIIML